MQIHNGQYSLTALPSLSLRRLCGAAKVWPARQISGPAINETVPKMRILVADDHAVVRAGLKTILRAREGWEICAEAGTGDEAVAFAKKYRPDVAMLPASRRSTPLFMLLAESVLRPAVRGIFHASSG